MDEDFNEIGGTGGRSRHDLVARRDQLLVALVGTESRSRENTFFLSRRKIGPSRK